MAPTLSDLLSTAQVLRLPLHTKFRGVLEREILIFEGPLGWAEFSPFLEYEDAEAAVWLNAAIEYAYGPIDSHLPEPQLTKVGVNATLPAVGPAAVAGVLARYGNFRTVKIKVAEPSQDVGDDVERVLEVRKLYPNARIRLDANGGWQIHEVILAMDALLNEGIEIEYLEQPVQSIHDMILLREKLESHSMPIRIAADELVRKAHDPLAVARAGAADILVLKAAPLGGITNAIAIAKEANLPVVVSSALESSIGLSMGAYLAATLPMELTRDGFDHGLGTAALMVDHVTDVPVLPVDGYLDVRRVEPKLDREMRLAASHERREWWTARLTRCYNLLSETDLL